MHLVVVTQRRLLGDALLVIKTAPATPDGPTSIELSAPLLPASLVRRLKRDIKVGDTLAVATRFVAGIKAGVPDAWRCTSARIAIHRVRSNVGADRFVTVSAAPRARLVDSESRAARAAVRRTRGCNDVVEDSATTTTSHPRSTERSANGCCVRAAAFAEWIALTFSSAGAGAVIENDIVDVAGGRGELSMALSLAGVPTLLIDPRPFSGRLSKRLRKALRKCGRPPLSVCRAEFPLAAATTTTTAMLSGVDEAEAAAKKERLPILAAAAAAAAAGGGGAGTTSAHDGGVIDVATARGRVAQCAAVVALHPDECTVAVVEWALAHRRSFAVVPCCVFARLFPDRALKVRVNNAIINSRTDEEEASEGRAAAATTGETVPTLAVAPMARDLERPDSFVEWGVRSYDDLVAYILSLHPAIHTATLPFVGKNVVLFAHGAELGPVQL